MRAFLCATAVALVAVSSPAWANCYSDAEATAARVRVMQTDFMVAALSCDTQGVPEVRQRYTILVKQYAGEMAVHGRALIAYFQRYGGSRALDTFVTSLANELALSASTTPGYCRAMLVKMDRGLTGKVTLASLAPAVGYERSRGPGDCGKAAPVTVNVVIKKDDAVAPVKQAAPIPPPAPVASAPIVAPPVALPAAKAPAAAPVVTAAPAPAAKAVPVPPVVVTDTGKADTTLTTIGEPKQDLGEAPDASRTGFAP